MIRCPSDQRLELLLEEQLDRRELADLERHLERCGRCQGALEELTRDRFSLGGWDAPAGPPPGPEGVEPSFELSPGRRGLAGPHRVGHPPTMLHPDPAADPRHESPPKVEGYEILGRLGHGGMGVVYRARQHGLDRLVALKMIRAGVHAAPEHRARFRIEARSVARLRHPNVVQIYDVGEADGLPFVALELLEGGSLEARVAGTPQPERESAELVATLAGAIGAAHRAGVAHRDLKPANVLFDLDGTPKVADFGLAKRLDQDDGQTHSGQVMGSPSFMAPEQALGHGGGAGPAADLYSLGAILYEMLTGRPPFKGASAMETLFQVVHDEPVPPTRLRPGLSRDLETICLKCLAKEPARRYADADALAEDLRRHLAGQPVLARRTGPRERLWKWARRQPAAAILAALVVAMLAGLALAGHRALQRGEERARRAEALRLEGEVVLDRAARALADERWEAGLGPLHTFLGRIEREPRLGDLRGRGEAMARRLERGALERAARDEARRHLDGFARSRREAQLRDAQLAGVGPLGDVSATRRAARSALVEFGSAGPDGDWTPAPIPDSLTAPERAELARGRYELLLIWADAVAQPMPGEDPARQAVKALRILEGAPRHHPPTRAYHLIRAACLDRLGDESAAVRERQVAESIPAVDAFGRVLRGKELHRLRRWREAIAEFEAALRLEPGQFRAQLLLAVCQVQDQRPDQARVNLTACLEREPESVGLHLLRGFAHGEEGYRKQKEARESHPRPAALEAEAQALFEAAEADFRTAMGLGPDPEERYALLVNRGTLRIRSRRLDDAVADLAEAVRLRPDLILAHVSLGQAYRKQGRVEEAIEQFSRGIALRPEMPALYRSRALARLERGRTPPEARERAVLDLSEAIRLERPGSPEAVGDLGRRARLLHLGGRHEEALADAEDALRGKPDDPDALLIRAEALHALGRTAELAAACDEALARGRPSAELHELRGLARADRRDYAGAIQDYTQALAIEPGRASSRVHRGWAYLVSDAPRLALHDFDEAVAADDADALGGRGLARALLGQHGPAVVDAEESLRRGEPGSRTAYNAARIYSRSAEAAVAEAPRQGRARLRLADDYLDRAQALVRLALERLPDDRRVAFWRDVVQPDPALAAIRQRPKFSQLAGQYGRPAK